MGKTCQRGITSSRIELLQNAYRVKVPRTLTLYPEGKRGVIQNDGLLIKTVKIPPDIQTDTGGDTGKHVYDWNFFAVDWSSASASFVKFSISCFIGRISSISPTL